MNSILILFLPFITVFSSPSPSETLDKLIPQLIGRTEQLSNLTYDEYKFVFSPSYFKTPLIKNMTKEIKGDEVIGRNIWMTLQIQNLYLVVKESTNIIFYRYICPEFEIKEIVLRLDEISNKVILKNLTITTPKIDMYWPFMTSTFFTDFQIDKNDKFKIEITSILTSFINALLTNINN